MEGNVFTTAAVGGRRREGVREGFPDSALSPLHSGGAPGLGCSAEPPPLGFIGGGAYILFMGKVTPPPLW